MVYEADIWRLATLVMRKHGERAPLFALCRADTAHGEGDLGRQQAGRRILRAVEEICRREMRAGERLN